MSGGKLGRRGTGERFRPKALSHRLSNRVLKETNPQNPDVKGGGRGGGGGWVGWGGGGGGGGGYVLGVEVKKEEPKKGAD